MVLNIFVKKSLKTPAKELSLAVSRVLTIITK
jgi:phage-related protein